MKLNEGAKILLIPHNGIGDNIMFLPLAFNIKKQLPNTQIHILSNTSNGASQTTSYSKYIDKVIGFKFGGTYYTYHQYLKFYVFKFIPLLIKILKNNYDYVFTYNPNLLINSILFFVKNKKIIKHVNYNINQYQNILNLTTQFENIPVNNNYSDLLTINNNQNNTLSNHTNYILFNFSGNSASRQWQNPETFISKLYNEIDKNIKIVLIGKNFSIDNNHIPSQVLNLINNTTIYQAIDLIDKSLLFVTVDSGLMHIACALNKPTIALFGSVHSSYLSPVCDNLKYYRVFDGNKDKFAFEKRQETLNNNKYIDNIDKDLVLRTVFDFINNNKLNLID